MRYAVTPGEGVGAVRFGMSREDVHTRLGEPDDEGGWPDSGEIEDTWSDDGLAVVFDSTGACVEIAVFPPATVSVRGARLLGEADGDALEQLRELDTDCAEEDGVIVAPALGLLYEIDDEGDPELLLLAPGRLDALGSGAEEDDDTEPEA